MSSVDGRRFGRYRLLRPLASDAISTTWYATGEAGGGRGAREARQFTVRVIEQADGVGDPHRDELVRRFLADVQRAGAIDHPAILRPHDSGVVEGHPYVATPFVRAVPLGEMLTHDGAITQAAALATFAQLAAGLDAAHRAGVVHGAVSPRTVWVGPGSGRGVAYVGYLTGFGTDVLLRAHLARSPRGAPLDDVLYVAPEQLRGEPPTAASDQYALAGAMFHTLASSPPFERVTRSKLYGAHLMASPPDLTDHDPAAPASVTVALRRGLRKQPGERFASCGALVNAALPARGQAPPAQSGGRRRGARAAADRDVAGRASGHAGTERRAQRPRTATAVASVAAGQGGAGRGRSRSTRSGRPSWQLVVAGIGVLLSVLALWALLRSPSASSTASAREGAAQPSERTTAFEAGGTAGVEPGWSAKVSDAAISTLGTAGGVVVAVDEAGTLAGVGTGAGKVRWRRHAAEVGADAEGADGGAGIAIAAAGGSLVAGGAQLAAYDARSGAQRWTVDGPTRSLSILDDTVIGVADTAAGREVLAVTLADGAEAWHIHGQADAADQPLIVASAGGRAYALQGQRLLAIDPTAAAGTVAGRQQVNGPTWQEDLTGARPLLVPTADGVVVAHDDGQVCGHAAADGAMQWCEPVPGVEAATPRLLTTAGGIVVATPEAVVALDPAAGAPRWSVSPGATGAMVAASHRAVVVAGDDGQVAVLDPQDGDELLSIPGAGQVTAVATRNDRVMVAGADGTLRAFDLPTGG